MEQLKNFIGGEFVAPNEGKYLDKISPMTAQKIYELPDSSEVDVVLAIKAAQGAFSEWSEKKAVERSQILNRVADLIDQHREALARAESEDVGKPLDLSRTLDIPRAALNFRFFASAILHKHEMASDMDGEAINYVLRQPVGVAGLISPWNLPLYLLTWKIAPALACGNTVVCKPSEWTSKTAFMLGSLLNEAGVPKGVVNMVFGKGDPAGAYLVKHPGVPLISFTGGTATGEKIQTLAAPYVKKLSLELGGKNATIVMKDADLAKVIPQIARASFLNQGEICLCGSKILVQEDIYKEFTEQFVKHVESLVVGDPMDSKTFMGPIVSKTQYDKVLSLLEVAKKDGGKVLTGGVRPELPAAFKDGYFLRPTVIGDLTNCSEIHQTEIFGPVVTLNSFKYAHEAVKWANNSPYGLSASVWTKNLNQAHKIAADLRVGTVWVNTWLKRDLRMPFGGAKASGLGREGGEHSLDFFTETKTVCIQL
ncbi:MAG: aldehyde dehydrogenase [Bdellovibrionales bacterium]|nr:aldehyde dehydrogenase [Bdellovibrionales bacterium]